MREREHGGEDAVECGDYEHLMEREREREREGSNMTTGKRDENKRRGDRHDRVLKGILLL